MLKRWFISPVVGTGARADTYRPKASDHGGIAHASILPCNADGTPKFGWALCLASAADLTALDGDAQIDGFPDAPLDTTLGSFSAAVRNRVQTALVNRSVDLTGITLASTLRDLVVRIVARLDDRCDHRAMDVP